MNHELLLGTWQQQQPPDGSLLVLEAGGHGSLGGQPIRFEVAGSVLSIAAGGQRLQFQYQLQEGVLMILSPQSGLCLFTRTTPARAPFPQARPGVPPGQPAGGGSATADPGENDELVGVWRSGQELMELTADGFARLSSGVYRYSVSGGVFQLIGTRGTIPMQYRLTGDTLTLTLNGKSQIYERGVAPSAGGSQADGPLGQVAGIWICEESSLDPSFYMAITQYVTLFPDGSVGFTKQESGVSSVRVSNLAQQFRYWQNAPQSDRRYGRWQTDGFNVEVRWSFDRPVSVGQVNPAAGSMTLTNMGILDERATLPLKRGG